MISTNIEAANKDKISFEQFQVRASLPMLFVQGYLDHKKPPSL